MWGWKQQVVLNTDNEHVGPSLKKARVALPWQNIHADRDNRWRQRIVDALEVANAEYHTIWTWFEGVERALEYLIELTYKVYVEGCEDFPSEPDE